MAVGNILRYLGRSPNTDIHFHPTVCGSWKRCHNFKINHRNWTFLASCMVFLLVPHFSSFCANDQPHGVCGIFLSVFCHQYLYISRYIYLYLFSCTIVQWWSRAFISDCSISLFCYNLPFVSHFCFISCLSSIVVFQVCSLPLHTKILGDHWWRVHSDKKLQRSLLPEA